MSSTMDSKKSARLFISFFILVVCTLSLFSVWYFSMRKFTLGAQKELTSAEEFELTHRARSRKIQKLSIEEPKYDSQQLGSKSKYSMDVIP